MDLLALADFTLVARHGGFGAASRPAHRPKATLSRRVGELGAALDLRLFERGRRDLKLTEEGRALFEGASVLLTELDETAATIALGGGQVRGRLRISAPLVFSQTAMGKLAAEFARCHPAARLEVTADDHLVDMIEEGYDLAIRVNPAPDATLVGRPFLHDRLVAVASPNLPPRSTVALPAIVRGADAARSWALADGQAIAIEPMLRLSSLMTTRDAVHAGAGAACLPLSLVLHDLTTGRLERLGNVAGSEIALWALYPSRRLLNARVSAFLDLLRHSFSQAAPEELAAYLVG